jgi:hypothetical protein
MKRTTFFVLLLALELSLPGQNLVQNPGFDSWLSVAKPAGWVHIENCTKDSADFMSASFSCRHTGGKTTVSDLGQTINVSAGKTYMLSFHYRTAANSTGNGARIWCYWKDISGTNLSDPQSDAVLRPSAYLKSQAWKQFSITVVAPANATAFYLEVRTYSNCTTNWDDFEFKETTGTSIKEDCLAEWKIFPNPASDFITINCIDGYDLVEIYGINGMRIRTWQISGQSVSRLSVSDLPGGIYYITIRSSGKFTSKLFIKS